MLPTLDISLAAGSEEFGAMVVMREGGVKIRPDILQPAFQTLLDNATVASEAVAAGGYPNGLAFHEHNWALTATILYQGETIQSTGILLDRASVFLAVAHDPTYNIDLQVSNASGEVVEDTEPDGNPAVVIEAPDANSAYDATVSYKEGNGPTLATTLVLKLAD